MHLLVPLVTAEIVKDRASLIVIFGQSISIKSTEYVIIIVLYKITLFNVLIYVLYMLCVYMYVYVHEYMYL